MVEKCDIILSRDTYFPGETVEGRVELHISSEEQVKAIRVRFKGRAKVFWKEGRYTIYSAEEIYFILEPDLLLSPTTFPPGVHTYPFTYDLPYDLPSSMDETLGNIKYSVMATIERSCGTNCENKVWYNLCSYNDLSRIEGLEQPLQIVEEKMPFSLSDGSGPIKIIITLPRNGFTPSQMVPFSAKVINKSTLAVQELRFKFVQGYEFHADNQTRKHISLEGEEFVVEDSSVSPSCENWWNLESRVPSDMFVGNLNHCSPIKIFWQLRGDVILPFPHTNFQIHVPLILGIASSE